MGGGCVSFGSFFGVIFCVMLFLFVFFGGVFFLEGLGWCRARRAPQQPNPSFFVLFPFVFFFFMLLFCWSSTTTKRKDKRRGGDQNGGKTFIFPGFWGSLGGYVWKRSSQTVNKTKTCFPFFFAFSLLLSSSLSLFLSLFCLYFLILLSCFLFLFLFVVCFLFLLWLNWGWSK